MADLKGGSKVGGYPILHSGLTNAFLGGGLSVTGNVGVGTTSPQAMLHVNNGQLLAHQNNAAITSGSYATGNIQVRTSDASNPIIGFHRAGYTAVALFHDGSMYAPLRLRTSANDDYRLMVSNRKTAAQINDTMLASGVYENSGDGILTPAGAVFKSGWWHIVHSYHYDNNGYAAQLAMPLSPASAADANLYMRYSTGTTWGNWVLIGGNRFVVPVGTDMYAT